jgi:hypothetical protein
MTQADDRLKALFALDEPARRDPVFSTTVMEKLMRRRFQEDVALLSGLSVVGGGAFWLLWPTFQPVLVSLSQGLVPALGGIALAAATLVVLQGRPVSALGLES